MGDLYFRGTQAEVMGSSGRNLRRDNVNYRRLSDGYPQCV